MGLAVCIQCPAVVHGFYSYLFAGSGSRVFGACKTSDAKAETVRAFVFDVPFPYQMGCACRIIISLMASVR